MRKKAIILFLLFVFFRCSIAAAASAGSDSMQDAKTQAKKMHNIASSDMLYANEELKALYYQNVQIIELLKEIRNALRQHPQTVR